MNKQTPQTQRREQRRARSAKSSLQQPPFRQPKNQCPPLEIASAERIERIHRASLDKIISQIQGAKDTKTL